MEPYYRVRKWPTSYYPTFNEKTKLEKILKENKPKIGVVWFKRDLRIFDHRPLFEAVKKGDPIIPLYILEPDLWSEPDMSHRHYRFLTESIEDLRRQLSTLGLELTIRVGSAKEVLQSFSKEYENMTIYSHQETWNNWTYQRDLEVLSWTELENISWFEYNQTAVVRRLKSRDHWSKLWDQFIAEGIYSIPQAEIITLSTPSDDLPSFKDLDLPEMFVRGQQKGGRIEAVENLRSFLRTRGVNYSKGISSPNTAPMSCSRISPYLAFGCISIREVLNAAQLREFDLAHTNPKPSFQWRRSIEGFKERLRWHCHFMQKLEDEPEIEYQNLHPAFDRLRNNESNKDIEKLEAWKNGTTGFPFIDACMRSLIATGWINFRMRAMLMSFASFHLWLDWRQPAKHLAQLFLDYEPGIHYPQVQMQSATTGINTIRIYNPIKQSQKQDPRGQFIRRWLPELAHLNDEMIHTPWLLDEPPKNYPAPIVDEQEARKDAASVLYGLKKFLRGEETCIQIIKKHASRKKPFKRGKKKKNSAQKTKSTASKKNRSFEHHKGQGVLPL